MAEKPVTREQPLLATTREELSQQLRPSTAKNKQVKNKIIQKTWNFIFHHAHCIDVKMGIQEVYITNANL